MGDIVQLPTQSPPWRDEAFDAWLRDQENLEVFGRPIDAADALATDMVAYLDGLEQWRNETREQLDHRVIHEFPQPIAAFYKRLLKGKRDPVRRFLSARDTWETLIHLLHAIVLAEVRAADLWLNESGINPACVDCQTLRERIELVRLSVDKGQHELPVSRQITPPLLQILEQLVALRNAFSHATTPTEQQALRFVEDAEPLLVTALQEASWLSGMELIRPQGLKQKQALRGHCAEPDCCEARWTRTQRATLASSEDPERELYLSSEEHLLALSPLLRAEDAPDSHGEQVTYLKQRRRTTLIYGVFSVGADQICSEAHCL
jgi:hypothetical protein